jgi:hypothetical protein
LLHRIVANVFLEKNINSKMTVNHKDGNRQNNRVDNLEWLSRADNIKYGFKNNQYKNCCKKCLLKSNNTTYEFYSIEQANKFLGRSPNYILRRKRKKINLVYDKKGNEYKIIIQGEKYNG